MSETASADRRINLCHALIDMRRAIVDLLGFALCPNPVWDMLLDLYVAQHEDRDVYLWPLCMGAHAPVSTAHRKLSDMEKDGLLSREISITDRRRTRVKLTPRGIDLVGTLIDRIDARFSLIVRPPC